MFQISPETCCSIDASLPNSRVERTEFVSDTVSFKTHLLTPKLALDVFGLTITSAVCRCLATMESAKFLNDLMDVYKISSSDITNKPFIEYICGFNKPIILSTGAANLIEIQEAVDWIEKYSNPLALLHCILNYPTLDENANLGMIKGLKKAFPKKIIGYSDHTLPKKMKTLEIATLLGAAILEKHFTHNKSLPGNDHYHAMDKNDLKVFCQNINEIFNLYGSVEVRSLKEEISSIKNARRSLVTSKLIKKGEIIKLEHLTFKRPASGISPKFIDQVLGKIAKEDISEDSILNWEMLET